MAKIPPPAAAPLLDPEASEATLPTSGPAPAPDSQGSPDAANTCGFAADHRGQDGEADFAKVLPQTDGAWSWTPDTGEVSFSARWLEQLGFAQGETPPDLKAYWERMHPDDVARVSQALEECAGRENTSFTLEFRLRHKDGTYRWMLCRGGALRDASGRVTRLTGANTDITAQKEAEQALRESEARFRMLAQNTPDAVFLHDMAGKILDFNDQACLLLGYDRETLTRLCVTDFEVSCPAEVLHGIWANMQPGPFRFEGLARRADGTTFPTEVHGVAFIERGRTLSLVAARDLTLRKQYEQRLAEARDAAMNANRAKTEFLANMSHEIRTPMHIILGMAELLRETALAPEQARYLTSLESAGQVLLHLINDILDISQIEANKLELRPQSFDPAALVGQVRDMMAVAVEEKGLSFTVRLDAKLPARMVNDPDRVRQVLLNLLWNAVKFTAAGGIALEATRCGAPGAPSGAPGLRLDVTDTGVGIAPEDCDRIFAPFTQARAGRRPTGTGLGLAICKSLVERMGGAISVDSVPGQGSRFTCTLPSLSGEKHDASRRESATSPTPPPLARRRRLLLVEDSLANREMVRLFLDKEPYDIAFASTGVEALTRFAPGRFDIVLMDMEMPELDGCAATEAIRRVEAVSRAPRTPVLMLSAHAFADYERKALAAGCDAFLTKPVRKATLLGTLSGLLAAPRDSD
ncbi:PAS domain-containing hybrid sensor histidine kinase/response regulator [Solidesulfovibrio alcoholivorans]|uniref:PAS domain-containing hybrid sensor histidine kinase/response regulator n=1 Tax=Solidesulfovibrio alcoholivorans TaxID=81406 RepID=UPI000A05AC8A|nr:hybrid sensor histidine kinase/response regulator [Solidesulfovibrio alcoholivorans]